MEFAQFYLNLSTNNENERGKKKQKNRANISLYTVFKKKIMALILDFLL